MASMKRFRFHATRSQRFRLGPSKRLCEQITEAKCGVEAFPASAGGIKGICCEVKGLAVVGLQHEQPQSHG